MSTSKQILVTFALGFVLGTNNLLAKPSFEPAPLTDSDSEQATKWETKLSDCQSNKTLVNFGNRGYVTVHWIGFGSDQRLTLPSQCSSVSLLTFAPKDGDSIKRMCFVVAGQRGAVASYLHFDASKVKFTTSRFIDGVFTMTASATEDFSKPEYEIQISTSKEPPPKMAAER